MGLNLERCLRQHCPAGLKAAALGRHRSHRWRATKQENFRSCLSHRHLSYLHSQNEQGAERRSLRIRPTSDPALSLPPFDGSKLLLRRSETRRRGALPSSPPMSLISEYKSLPSGTPFSFWPMWTYFATFIVEQLLAGGVCWHSDLSAVGDISSRVRCRTLSRA